MTTTITLSLCNYEVNRLFARTLSNGDNFYHRLLMKITSLIQACYKQQVFAFLALYQMHEQIAIAVEQFYDEIDNYEGILEKRNYLVGKNICYTPKYFPVIPFECALDASLSELFKVYDNLLSILKILRKAGCFSRDDDYYFNLRRHFKTINCLLSSLIMTRIKRASRLTLDDVVHQKESYQDYLSCYGEIDYTALYKALTTNIAPRLEEKTRQTILTWLTKRMHQTNMPNTQLISHHLIAL